VLDNDAYDELADDQPLLAGMTAASIMGLVWGIAFLLCGRNLWIVILAHSAAHIALVLQLYSQPTGS
jgi:hypothetical protein